MPAKTIAVLLHETDKGFDRSDYLLRAMLPLWRDMGHAIEAFNGVDRHVAADALFPHIDLTVIPEAYRRFAQQHAATVNRSVMDISKSRISRNLVTEGDAYTGQVIVKTDMNYGGIPEKRLGLTTGQGAAPPAPDGAPGAIDWSAIRYATAGNYPIFESLAQVPPAVFRNRNLVVEKFLPERDGEYYCLRYCYFLGDRSVSTLMRSKRGVIKGSKSMSCEEALTPPECHAFRERMGFEYGKLDYVIHDGKAIVFDVSRTPAISVFAVHKHMRWVVGRIAEGIGSILDRAGG